MDKQSNILEKLKKYLEYSNENFLITITNKGIYNRAKKDMEKVSNWGINLECENISINIDEIKVKLNENLYKSKCSCPSKTVCKHIVMAIIYINKYINKTKSLKENKENTNNIKNDITNIIEEDYKELKSINLDELKKLSEKKNYEYAINKINEDITVNFKEENILIANIVEENITVYFPKKRSIELSICKCSKYVLCKHKIIAILSYLKKNGVVIYKKEPVKRFDENKVHVLIFSRNFVSNILEKGLYACDENDEIIASQLATKLYTIKMDNLSKLFRQLSANIKSMTEKLPDFNKIEAMSLLSKIYNLDEIILRNKNNKEILDSLIETSKKKYSPKSYGEFIGIGSYPWIVKSGYSGVTAYLFNKYDTKIYTYTNAMANFYEKTESSFNNLIKTYKAKNNWANNLSIKTISESTFKLIEYKSNCENRISSSKRTIAEINRHTYINEDILKELDGIIEKDYDAVINRKIKYDYFSKKESSTIVLAIPYNKIENVLLDNIRQTLFFSIVNCLNRSLKLQISHFETNKNAIAYIINQEDFNKKNIKLTVKNKEVNKKETKYMIVRIIKVKDKIVTIPVSIIDSSKVHNIFFKEEEK